MPWPPRSDHASSAYSSHFSQICTRSAGLNPRSFSFLRTAAACSIHGGNGGFFPIPGKLARPQSTFRRRRAGDPFFAGQDEGAFTAIVGIGADREAGLLVA